VLSVIALPRNANAGQSSGPLEIDRPWDSHTSRAIRVVRG
jgi:hypothetical protein